MVPIIVSNFQGDISQIAFQHRKEGYCSLKSYSHIKSIFHIILRLSGIVPSFSFATSEPCTVSFTSKRLKT